MSFLNPVESREWTSEALCTSALDRHAKGSTQQVDGGLPGRHFPSADDCLLVMTRSFTTLTLFGA